MGIAGVFGRALQVLRMPWLMASSSSRWIAFSLIALCASGVTWLGQSFPSTASSWMGYAALFCITNAFCWFLFVPKLLALARAAWQLRVPRVRRDIALAGLAYACVGIAVPIAVLPAHALVVGLALALSATCAALMLLLPASVVLATCIAWSVLPVVDGQAVVGRVVGLHPLWWSGVALVVSAAGVVSRWRHLVRADAAAMTGWRAPAVMRLRLWPGALHGLQGDVVRPRSAWLSAAPALRRIGPEHPVGSMRIVLGQWYLPQILTVRACLLGLAILAVAVPVLFRDAFGSAAVAQRTLWLAESGSFALSLAAMGSVTERWRGATAELSLLALLPGFGDAHGARRAVLFAVFGLPAKQLGFLLLVTWAAIAWGHLGLAVAWLVLLAQLAWLGLLVATLPGVLGGRPLRYWGYLVLWVGMGLLVAAGFWLIGDDGGDANLRVALEVAAPLMAFVLLVLGFRGWTALWRQPHVFFANAS